jgi:hypothetical protein
LFFLFWLEWYERHRLPACFRSNQVRVALTLLAYSLGNSWPRLALPKRIESWSANSSQQRLIKAGGRLVKHPRFIWPYLGWVI